MKKIYLLGAVALLAAAGCNKELPQGNLPSGSVVLTASVETDGTKVGATVNEETKKVAFTWTKGDAVAVQTASGFETFSLSGNGGEATGEFVGNAAPAAGGVAVFPAAAAGAVSGNNLTLNLPASYTYVAGQTNALLSAKVADNNLAFTHLGGLVAIELKGVPAGAKLVFTAKDKQISGAYTVDLAAETPQVNVAATTSAADSTLTVNFAEAAVEALVYLPLPVGEYPSWTAKVLGADDAVLKEVSTTSAKTVARKTLKAMPYMIVDLKDWFVSPTGAGDKSGSSWDNAMDQVAFNVFMNHDYGKHSAEKCEAFNGSTIHFAEGKYNFVGAAKDGVTRFKLQYDNMGKECNITFKGGYAADSKGTDLSKRDASKYVTKLTGDANNNDQADRQEDTGIFCVDNWAFLTFDGITFTCAGGDKTIGSGVVYRQGAFVANSDNNKFSLTFTNCIFKDLFTSDYVNEEGSKKGCGAALFTMKNGTVKIDNCQFENCTGHHVGGCICLSGASTTLTVSNSTFKNCVSENTHGGAISSGEGAPYTVKNCTFEDCSAKLQAGALYANKGTVLTAEGCTFKGCHTVNTSGGSGGAISLDSTGSPVGNIKDCVFDGCEAKDQGGAINLAASAIAKVDGCVVKGCIARNRGGFARLNSNSVLFVNNSAAYDCNVTGDWGSVMASSGGHFLINNCTFEHNTVGNKGATLNGSGAWAIISSTVFSNTELASGNSNAAIRWDSGKSSLLMNSMFFYTGSQTDADDAAVYLTSATNTMVNGGYNVYNTSTNMAAAATDKVGNLPAVYGLTWNTDHYMWNGLAADASKATLAEIEEALKTKVNVAVGSFTNLGLDFYNWLQEIGGGKNPLAYDQKGNARNTNAMWPGAYEKN